MGMYDYVGTSGDQVKCFYVPYITVKKDKNGNYRAYHHTSGGRIVNVNKTPYMTPYYNYGPNFAILDYSICWNGDNTEVHIIRDGNWVETLTVAEMEKANYKLPPVILDADGTRYKARSIQDIKNIIRDYAEAKKEQKDLTNTYLQMRGYSPQLDFEKLQTLSDEERLKEFSTRNIVSRDVMSITMEYVDKKWVDVSHNSELQLMGNIFAYYQDCKTRNIEHHEFEWYVACAELYATLKKKHQDPVVDYMLWCNKEGIELDRDAMVAFFDKYNRKPTDAERADYEQYVAKRGY